MMRHGQAGAAKMVLVAALASAAVAGTAWLVLQHREAAPTWIAPTNADQLVRGKAVYEQYCASCHGARLEGQPAWRQRLSNGRLPAPPHDESGHTWHHPDALLIDIIRHGLVPGRTAPEGYESDMPAYDKVLSDDDIVAVLAYIKSKWPPEALEAQKRMTLQRND